MPRECLAIIESKSKVRYSCNKPVVVKVSMNTSTSGILPDVVELKDMVKALLLDKKSQHQAHTTVKPVEETYVTCGGAHSYRNCPATDGNAYRDNIQEFVSQASAVNYNQGNTSYRPPMIGSPKEVARKTRRPRQVLIPCDFPGKAEYLALADLGASINLMPFSMWNKLSLPDFSPTCMTLELADRSISHPVGVAEDVYVKVGTFHFQVDFVIIDFDVDPRVPLILERSFLKTRRALIDVFEGELTLRVDKEAITFNLDQTSRYSANYNEMTAKRIDVIDMACEELSQEVLGYSDVIASDSPTPYYDPIVSTTSPTLTPFENSYFLLEEVDAFLALEDDPTSPEVNQSYLDSEGDILLLEAFLNDDPSLPSSNQGNYLPEVHKELKICKAKSDKSLVDEPPEVELKDLPPHLEYAFLEGDDKLPIIILKDLSVEEKTALITVLKSHKRAIAWKLSNIKGIDPEFCIYKILMEEDFEPAVQHQRRENPKIHDGIRQEVLKLLDAGLIYPISDSPWVSPVHCVPKKGGFTVVENEDNKLIPTRLVTEGIVLGHKISKQGIKVDKAKVDVITKLPHPTTVKGIRSFLGHADFYRRFIKDFSKIARPRTRLLEKDTSFFFSKECVEAFQTLKRKLTEDPILIAPDWDMPFELMCDASDFAIGAVLVQSQDKHFRPIHYGSKTMTEAESNYTTTKKEMLAMVDQGTHFCNDQFAKVMQKFAVTHRLATPYHPQTSGQVEVSNGGLKCILERTVGENRASWSDKLDDALWAFRTAYKTPIGCTSYKLVYGKACHLPIELEHKAYSALKHANFDLQIVGDHRKVQLNELRDQAYENSLIYKEKTKRLHDSKIKDRVFNIGDRVLLFNSRLKILSGKLKSSWSSPFTISHVYPYGTVELSQPDGPNFKVNGHRV
nr:reverse transcriptase domain-containing protein [Tanacetum cinerariifolium]